VAYVGEFLSTPLDFDKAVEGYDPGPAPNIVKRDLDEAETSAGVEDAQRKVDELLRAIEQTKSELKAKSL